MSVTSIHWPDDLPPTPVTKGGEFARFGMPDNTSIFNKPDSGPPTARARSEAFYRPVKIPLALTSDEQADRLYEFFMVTLAAGTQPFRWEGWVRTGSSVFKFDPSEDPPEPQPAGNGVHFVNLNLLQYPAGAS